MKDHALVTVAMVTDFVASGYDLSDQFFVPRNPSSDSEESGVTVKAVERSQCSFVADLCGGIIKGQRNHPRIRVDVADRLAHKGKATSLADPIKTRRRENDGADSRGYQYATLSQLIRPPSTADIIRNI